MKEFMYYQNKLDQFTKLFVEHEKISQIWSERCRLGLEDDTISWHLDFMLNKLGELCCHNHETDFVEAYTAYITNKCVCYHDYNNQVQIEKCKNEEDLFDICYAMFLKDNLMNTILDYMAFGIESQDTFLFFCWDNEYIDKMYSDIQLTEMAQEITNELDSETLNCQYDGEKFELIDN